MFLLPCVLLAAWLAVPQSFDHSSGQVSTPASTGSPALQSPQPPTKSQDPGSTAVLVPQQIRRVEPPPPNATANELEETADELRAEKAFADALDYYHAAMVKAPSSVLHNKIGIVYLEMMRKNEAKQEFERAFKMEKNYAEPYNNLGVLEYYFNRNYGRAVKYYLKAIKLKNASASFYSNLGSAYFVQKKYSQAAQEYAKALSLDPDIFERRSRGGVSLQLSGIEDRGRYEYMLAKMYANLGNSDRCLVYLGKAIEDGYDRINDVYKDREFTGIRKDPRFTALMASKSKILQIPPDQPPPAR